jgi:hypothetical protein
MKSVALCIASRGRPELLTRTLSATLANAVLPDTTCVVCLDHDDPVKPDLSHLPVDVLIVPRPDGWGSKFNYCARKSSADVFVIWCDDQVITTKGWDKQVAETPDFCLGTRPAEIEAERAFAVTRGMADLMGFSAAPYFPYWFIDTWLYDVAELADCIHETTIEIQGERGLSRGLRDLEFWSLFYARLMPLRMGAAHRIIKARGNVLDQDRIARAATEQAFRLGRLSHFETVAALTKRGFDAPEDERYLRIKLGAEEMLKGL